MGGMEHHPYWHLGTSAMGSVTTHAHEAAHGWYGNGVRMLCWEDFVLSEGTVSYLTARAIEAAQGEESAEQVWTSYQQRLTNLQNSNLNKIAWPAGCNELDIINDGLFGAAPYMRGAFFYRALERRIGRELLDRVLANFYIEHVGKATTMQALLDAVKAESGYDPQECALQWLRSEALPENDTCSE